MNNVMNKTWSYKGVIVLALLLGLVLTSVASADYVYTPMEQDLDANSYNISDVNDLDVIGDVNVTGTITATDIITKGPWVDVCAYASFSAAIDAIDTNETLLIPNSQVVDVNKTVPGNVTLWFLRGGELNISSGKTVTINGPVKAGLHKIFTGSGDVSFGSGSFKEVYPQWWGAVGDGNTDDTDALQAAFDSIADGQKIVIPPGTYDFNDTLTLDNDDAILDCQGVLKWTKTTDGTAVQVGTSAHHTFRIRVFLRLYNDDASSDAWDVNSIGVQITNTYESNITIEECKYFQIGLQLYGCPGEGVCYNQFTLGTLEDNKIGVDFNIANDGWVNQNAFYGGRFGYHYYRDSYAGSKFVNIPHYTPNTPYNNIFYSPCFECGNTGVKRPDYFVDCGGRHNAIIQPYCEGTPSSGYNVRFGSNSYGNVWEAGRPTELSKFDDDGSNNRIQTAAITNWGNFKELEVDGNITATGTIEAENIDATGDISGTNIEATGSFIIARQSPGGEEFRVYGNPWGFTQDRVLTILMDDAHRSLAITGTAEIDQNVKTTATPTFAGVTLSTAQNITGLKTTSAPTFDRLILTAASASPQIKIGTSIPASIGNSYAWDSIVAYHPQAGLKLANTLSSASNQGAGFIMYSMDGAAMSSGDRLGFCLFGGSTEPNSIAHGGGIVAYADADWDVDSAPTRLAFEVAPTDETSRSTAMTIKSTGRVGIGTTTPAGALDVASTTGAFIVPRMTTAQRTALTAVNGMIIYNTTTNQFNFYENGSWVTK